MIKYREHILIDSLQKIIICHKCIKYQKGGIYSSEILFKVKLLGQADRPTDDDDR